MSRSSRLSWFAFYVDDFLGGTSALCPAELGSYVLCLAAQWASAELRAIPADPAKLKTICRGEPPSQDVLDKFDLVKVNGKQWLRNERLAKEWSKARAEHDAKSAGGRISKPPTKQPTEPIAEPETEPPHNPQPTTHNVQTDNGTTNTGNGASDEPDRALASYAREIWAAHCRRKGEDPELAVMSSLDWQAVSEWRGLAIPLRVVLRAMQDTTKTGRTLAYYGPSVLERAAKRDALLHSAHAGDGA